MYEIVHSYKAFREAGKPGKIWPSVKNLSLYTHPLPKNQITYQLKPHPSGQDFSKVKGKDNYCLFHNDQNGTQQYMKYWTKGILFWKENYVQPIDLKF
jgi:hypothetical protein